MIRDSKGNPAYWDKWVKYEVRKITDRFRLLEGPRTNPLHDPEFSFGQAKKHLVLSLSRYSRGDPIRELAQCFPSLLDAWELSNRLSDEICAQHNLAKCRDWTFDLSDLNHYIWCFWLVGLALLLEVPDVQWLRLLALINGEGQDALLDRVIATRQPERAIGQKLLHSAPYPRLLNAINAPKAQQPELLKDFVEYWYAELDRPKKRGADPIYYRPYWYAYGDQNFEGGSYFGRWCIEAAVCAKVFSIDDSLCLGHPHYPGDLLRPEGSSTHPQRIELKRGFLAKLFGDKKP